VVADRGSVVVYDVGVEVLGPWAGGPLVPADEGVVATRAGAMPQASQ
jgi:hypothetical protein